MTAELVYDPPMPNIGDCIVQLTRDFAAPRALVWTFFTDATRLASWFGPTGVHVDPTSVVVEPHVGGRWDLDMVVDATGQVSAIRAEIVAIRAPEYLEGRMESRPPGEAVDDDAEPIVLRIWLHELAGATRLTLHQGPFGPGFRDVTSEGWELSFAKIDHLLERNPE